MMIKFVDADQTDGGSPAILCESQMETVPRIGEKQVINFPGMPPKNYVVVDVARMVSVAGNQPSSDVADLPHALQEQIQRARAQGAIQASSKETISIALRSIQNVNSS